MWVLLLFKMFSVPLQLQIVFRILTSLRQWICFIAACIHIIVLCTFVQLFPGLFLQIELQRSRKRGFWFIKSIGNNLVTSSRRQHGMFRCCSKNVACSFWFFLPSKCDNAVDEVNFDSHSDNNCVVLNLHNSVPSQHHVSCPSTRS